MCWGLVATAPFATPIAILPIDVGLLLKVLMGIFVSGEGRLLECIHMAKNCNVEKALFTMVSWPLVLLDP